MEDAKLFPDEPDVEEHVKKGEQQQSSGLSKSITTLGSRLRVLEEQYSNLRNKSQLAEGNFIEFRKEIRQEVKTLSHDIIDLKRMLTELTEKIDTVTEELGSAVKEHDFKVVEKYVDLWNPTKFVTKNHLKEELEKLKKD